MQTGSYLNFQKKTWKSLDELDAGVCDGMTYEEIEVSWELSSSGPQLTTRSKSTQRTTRVVTTINSITDIEVVNLIVMLSFVLNRSLWNWKDRGTSSSSVIKYG